MFNKQTPFSDITSSGFLEKILRVFIALTTFCVTGTSYGFSQNIGFILIKSNPSGASVFINSKDTGKKTPFQMQLDTGNYKFSLQYNNYHTLEGEFTILKGQTITKDFFLKPAFGNIKIISEPSEADISLDGVAVNQKTTATLTGIPSGLHNITLSKDMYSDTSISVTINDELNPDVFLELQPDYGTVGIIVKPDAVITIDEKVAGSGNYSGRLAPGKHKLVVTKEKYYPYVQEIIVISGQAQIINISLEPIFGILSIMVDPPETNIYLNRKYYGMSPKIIDSLIIGAYDLELIKEGFAIFRKHLIIEEKKTVKIENALKLGKLIKVKTTPTEAEVWYNGSVVGTTPSEFVVKEGSNSLILKKKYYAEKEVIVNAEKNDLEFIFNLEVDRTRVNISIETKPNKAGIKLKEKGFLPEYSSDSTISLINYSGTTPLNSSAPVSKYDLKVEKNGYKSIEKEIFLEKPENFTFNLEPIKYRTKGTALLLSVLWPGAGQSYLKRGSAYFLIGFVGYGSLAYSIVQHGEAIKNYDLYLVENNLQKRESLKSKFEKNNNMSNYAMYAGAAVWGINLIWTLATQSEVKKYSNVKFSLLNSPNGSIPVIGWRSDF